MEVKEGVRVELVVRSLLWVLRRGESAEQEEERRKEEVEDRLVG